MKILTAEQMRQVDLLSSERYGVPSLLLMENAGRSLSDELQRRFADLSTSRIAIICGKGNNGGDGMVLARHLGDRGLTPDVILLAEPSQVSGDARVQLEILREAGCPIQFAPTVEDWRHLGSSLDRYPIIVDAILGTGLTKPIEGFYLEVIQAINRSGAFILAVDIPSGMASDSTRAGLPVVQADVSVTFTAPKVAHILNEDQEAIGELVVVPIGSPAELTASPDMFLNLVSREEVASSRIRRKVASHKGDFGHVLIIAGSRGKSGAALLCSRAALRAGSGLVTAAVPATVQPIVASGQAEIMTEPLPETEQGTIADSATERVLQLLQGKDAAGLGPGISRNPSSVNFVRSLVRQCPVPLVLDADGLNAFEGRPNLIVSDARVPLVLTPHPGEFSRLCGRPVSEIAEEPHRLARDFAERHGLWLVLKGFRTLVAAPDGQVHVSPCGNPGMATGGSGDVLTGILTSLLGLYSSQKRMTPEEITRAVIFGVFLHGLAGDIAAARSGYETLIAGDLIERLGDAYNQLSS